MRSVPRNKHGSEEDRDDEVFRKVRYFFSTSFQEVFRLSCILLGASKIEVLPVWVKLEGTKELSWNEIRRIILDLHGIERLSS